MFPVEDGIHVNHHILPIFVGRHHANDLKLVSFEGTGFVIAPGVLVTCWHCVAAKLPKDQFYAAIVQLEDSSGYRAVYLRDITRHSDGLDLAVAKVEHAPPTLLTLASKAVRMGTSVLSWGYPLATFNIGPDGAKTFILNPRHLEGYVTRAFKDEDRGLGPADAYELDMPTPEGLSGAPLIKMGTSEVVGVVYGTNEVGLIKHFERIDEEGRREPEIQRVVTFGLAHYTASLHSLRGPATDGLPLAEYINKT